MQCYGNYSHFTRCGRKTCGGKCYNQFYLLCYNFLFKVKPSSFINEMNVSSEERLEKLKKSRFKLKDYTDFNMETFRVSPEIVIFQNFEIGKTYTAYLNILNILEVHLNYITVIFH